MMTCRSVFRNVFVAEPWMNLPSSSKIQFISTPVISIRRKISKQIPNGGRKIVDNSKRFYFRRNCSNNSDPYSPIDDSDQGPPQEAVLKAISEVSKTEGRVGQTTNVVIGGTVTDDSTGEWLELDQKVNSYPTVRRFTAIGTGGDDFVHSMVVAVETVLQKPVPEGRVKQKISSGGKYVSVNIGPVQVVSGEQVQAVYNAMRQDIRMKYFL